MASPQLEIISYPQTVLVGESFPLHFQILSADIGTTFHFKAVGDSLTDIFIFPSCANRYDSCDSLIISAESTPTATAYAQINEPSLSNLLKIRLADHFNHQKTYDSAFVSIISTLSALLATPSATPTASSSASVSATPLPSVLPSLQPPLDLIITEVMANPDTGQSEWLEFFNPNSYSLSANNFCFTDKGAHRRCLPENDSIAASSFYVYLLNESLLNNDSEEIYFLNQKIILPKSLKNFSFSLNSQLWCPTLPSPGQVNNPCYSPPSTTPSLPKKLPSPSPNYPQPQLVSLPPFLRPGEKFKLTFKLNSPDPFFLKINFPFSSDYFPSAKTDFDNSLITLDLTVPKKISPGSYQTSLRLKKLNQSYLYDFLGPQLTILKKISPSPKAKKVLGSSTVASDASATPKNSFLASSSASWQETSPDTSFFSWPFLFSGSILFLSPLIFPKKS